jgi:excisionase family DNA binding protein
VPQGRGNLFRREGDKAATLSDRITLRIDEVATATGLSVSLVRALIRDGELPVVKVRSVPLVRTTDLLAFLESRVSAPETVAERIADELAASLERREV